MIFTGVFVSVCYEFADLLLHAGHFFSSIVNLKKGGFSRPWVFNKAIKRCKHLGYEYLFDEFLCWYKMSLTENNKLWAEIFFLYRLFIKFVKTHFLQIWHYFFRLSKVWIILCALLLGNLFYFHYNSILLIYFFDKIITKRSEKSII